jgi:CubicO group peptidase (beta-lactamase class C family)
MPNKSINSSWLSLAVLTLLAALVTFAPSRAAALHRSVEGRIAAVENGLDPPVVVAGEPVKKWSIAMWMNRLKVPAVSVAVINDYKIEWARAWGVTEPGGNRPVTPETIFQAGSISKAVAAMGVMHLVQEGRLSLDANVNDELKTWKLHENEFTRSKAVTLRELLSHSAMTSIHGFPGYDVHAQLPTLVQVLDGLLPANTAVVRVEGVPGSGWQYSGGGYEIIQQMAIDQTGESFPSFMRTTVLDPLRMNHSTYEQPLPVALQTAAAAGTLADGSEVRGKWHVYPEMMAAGLWSTPSDVTRFAIALINAKRGESNSVISAATGAEMLTPQIAALAGCGVPSNYGIKNYFSDMAAVQDGLGVFLQGVGDGAGFSHQGNIEGFRAEFLGYYSGHGVVVMTNANGSMALAESVIRAVQEEYGWPQEPTIRK